MKNEKNRLDDFLQQKVEESSFAYNEAHWQKALNRLNEEDNNKKPIFPWWKIFGLLLLLSSAIFGGKYWLNTKSNKQIVQNKNSLSIKTNNTNAENTTNNIANKNTKESNTSNSKTTKANNENPTINNTENNSSRLIKKDTKIVTLYNTEKNNNVFYNNKSAKEKSTDAFTNKKINTNNKLEHPQVVTKLENDSINLKVIVNNENKIKINQTNNNKTKKIKTVKNIFTKNNWRQTNNNTEKAIGSKPNENRKTETNIEDKIQTKEIIIVKETTIEKRRMSDEEMIKYNPRYVKDLHAFTYKKTDTTYTQITTIPPIENTTIKPTPFNRNLIYFATAQLAFNKTLKGNINATQQWKPTPYIGMGAVLPLTAKLSISGMLALTYFSGLNTDTSSYNITYGFGKDSVTTKIKETKQFQIQLPIAMQYAFGKQYVQAGVGINYGFAVQNNITNNAGKTTNNFAYKNGINAIDYFLHIGYGININKNLAFSILLQQGVKDATKNSFYNNTISDKQTRATIGVIYKFNQKK